MAARVSLLHCRAAVGSGVTGRAGAALACALILLTACSDDPEGTATPSTTGSPTHTAASDPSPSAGASREPSVTFPAESPSSTGLAPPATTVAPTVASTADRSDAPPTEVIRVVAVEVDDADGAERIVIDTEGGTPGYRLRYVDAVRIDGEPVLVEGNAFLELVLESADPEGDQGLADEVAVDLLPDQQLIKHVQIAYYLGDELTYAIGVVDVVPFSVTTTVDQIVITFTP